MTSRAGESQVHEVFDNHSADDVFSLVFSDAAFEGFYHGEGRHGVGVSRSWGESQSQSQFQDEEEGANALSWERQAQYCFGESRVLRQGESRVAMKETAVREGGGWTVRTALETKGGPLASSTVISAAFHIRNTGERSATATCVLQYEFDLSSVSWLLRSAVDAVILREVTGFPKRLFAFAKKNSHTLPSSLPGCMRGGVPLSAGVLLYGEVDGDGVECLPAAGEGSSGSSAGITASTPSCSQSEEGDLEAQGVQGWRGPIPPATPETPVRVMTPARSRASLSHSGRAGSRSKVSRRKVRALMLIFLIVVFWLFSAMVGSAGVVRAN